MKNWLKKFGLIPSQGGQPVPTCSDGMALTSAVDMDFLTSSKMVRLLAPYKSAEIQIVQKFANGSEAGIDLQANGVGVRTGAKKSEHQLVEQSIVLKVSK